MRILQTLTSDVTADEIIDYMLGKTPSSKKFKEQNKFNMSTMMHAINSEANIDRFIQQDASFLKNIFSKEEIIEAMQLMSDKTYLFIGDNLNSETKHDIDKFAQTLLESNTIDVIMTNFYSRIDLSSAVYAFGSNFPEHVRNISKLLDDSIDRYDTQYCCNFIINKKKVNRYILLKLVEKFNLLNSCTYSWSSVDNNFNLQALINETTNSQTTLPEDVLPFVLSPITVVKRWIDTESDQLSETTQVITNNIRAWDNGLKEIFTSSAVSLITESVGFEHGIAFTEKSIFSVLGLTMPIWIGGKYQAEEFESLGFDVFHDFIDHSYQYHDSLLERCYYAVANNQQLLTDVEYARQVRQQVNDRLLKNRSLLMQYNSDKVWAAHQMLSKIDKLNLPRVDKNVVKLITCIAQLFDVKWSRP
jgi:hypothetical protein